MPLTIALAHHWFDVRPPLKTELKNEPDRIAPLGGELHIQTELMN